MALDARRGWNPVNTLVRQIDRDFDNLIRRSFDARGTQGFVPAANVVRDGSDVVVKLELPGLDPAEVDVEVSEGRLVISGKRTEETTEDNGVLIREIRGGAFRREFALPEGVGGEQVEAGYDRGVLKIRVRDVVRQETGPTKVEIHPGD